MKKLQYFLTGLGVILFIFIEPCVFRNMGSVMQTVASTPTKGEVQADYLTALDKELLRINTLLKEHFPSGWPIKSDTHIITSEYGVRINPVNHRCLFHSGIDIKASWWQPVETTAAGKVIFSGWRRGYGRVIKIDHGTYQTLYAHLQRRKVRTGDYVIKGQIIGYAGASGRATGPHLHYEVITNKIHLDPIRFVKK